ncbi:MAG: glycosyltransferase family 4 protein [Phycisphaeraceae bacterium]
MSDTAKQPKTLLVISQAYVPDPASVGQHMHSAAAAMAKRGYRVIAYASARGYDDPSRKYPKHEVRDGVNVRRLTLSSFGKASFALRLLAALLFVAQCAVRGLFVRNLGGVLVSTSPPMCSMAAIIIATVRRKPIVFWAMDINPDQLVTLGWATENSLPVRLLAWLNRALLNRADQIVTLDRFMAERLCTKADIRHKLHVMPPWPHEDHLEVVEHQDNPFRKQHGLEDKFVIMYSGNMGLTTPVTPLLQAALRLQDERDLLFMFIGGGFGMAEVHKAIEQHHPSNIKALPYQPMDTLKYSLSAADVHAVTMVDQVVGIVHPCKVYGAMTVQRPILFLGPAPSHVADLLQVDHIGWHVPFGDTDATVQTIRQILGTDRQELAEMGRRARQIIRGRLSEAYLCGRFADVMEQALGQARDA